MHPRVFAGIILGVTTFASQAASFTPLGDSLDESFSSRAYGVSNDGATVVGSSSTEAFRWTSSTGMVGLGTGVFGVSGAHGISGDGSTIVGVVDNQAFRWTSSTGMVFIGDLGGVQPRNASAVSTDGSVIVGQIRNMSGLFEAFRWTSAGIEGLGDLDGGGFLSNAFDVSADGLVVVGGGHAFSFEPPINGPEAFRWTGAGMVGIGDLPGGVFDSEAHAVSADGSVIVGSSTSASGYEAFRWTEAGGMVGLGDFPGSPFSSDALDVSGDGSVVVGFGSTAPGVGEAFVWTQATGMQRLLDVLLAGGATGMDGWTLTKATAVSADGNWVVGYGDSPEGTEAFLANIAPVPLPAVGWLLAPAFGLLGMRRRPVISN